MISPSLCRFSKSTLLLNATRASSRNAVRFSSSKKSDSKPEDLPTATATPPKKQTLTEVKKEAKSGSSDDSSASQSSKTSKTSKTSNKNASKSSPPKRGAQNYISFKDLPKPSKELQDMSTEQFNARLHMTNIPEKGLPKHEEVMPFAGFKYDFNLNPKHRLLQRHIPTKPGSIGRAPYGAIEPNLSVLGISIDTDTLTSGMEEHPLRESITGMCVMNPLMKEIKNKSLWEFFPENKKYGSSPFGNGATFNAFKDWEDSKNAKIKVFEAKKQEEEKEFRDFCKNLQESNSFVRKPAQQKATKAKSAVVEKSVKTTESSNKGVETSGRRKLDRGLLRQYRKYRKDQLIKEAFGDKEDE